MRLFSFGSLSFFVISSISHQPFPDHLMRMIGRGWRKSGKPRSKRSGGRSWVWKHLRKGSEKVGCLYCPSEFSLTSSTGTLKTHLVGTHKLEPENVTSGIAGKVDLVCHPVMKGHLKGVVIVSEDVWGCRRHYKAEIKNSG